MQEKQLCGQAHSTVQELLKTEEITYLTDKESGKEEGTLLDYLKERELIITLEEGKYQIDVEKLLGRNGSTGNGTDGKDVYIIEKIEDEESSGENEGIKYAVNYYNNDGEKEQVGELVDLYGVETITFNIKLNYADGHTENKEFTVRKGMTWEEFFDTVWLVDATWSNNGNNDSCAILLDDHLFFFTESNVHLCPYRDSIIDPNYSWLVSELRF